jgi:hypothetical protein
MKQPIVSKCRMSYKAEEHITHNVVGYTTFVPSEYSHRHNMVAGYIHLAICKRVGLQVTDRHNEHIPENFKNINSATIIWDVPAVRDRKILANRSDTALRDKEENACLMII